MLVVDTLKEWYLKQFSNRDQYSFDKLIESIRNLKKELFSKNKKRNANAPKRRTNR